MDSSVTIVFRFVFNVTHKSVKRWIKICKRNPLARRRILSWSVYASHQGKKKFSRETCIFYEIFAIL